MNDGRLMNRRFDNKTQRNRIYVYIRRLTWHVDRVRCEMFVADNAVPMGFFDALVLRTLSGLKSLQETT